MAHRSSLDSIFWLWLPALFFIGQIIIELSLPDQLLSEMHSEGGTHEILQFFIISFALLMALAGLARVDWSHQKWLGAWFGLAALCCLYVAGEEISWGQHVFYWDTPEQWAVLNDQNETNLHNTSSWLDQKPRLLLLLGIAFGGLVFPLLNKYCADFLPARFAIIYPDWRMFVVALFVVIPYLVEKAAEAAGFMTFVRGSEVQELYMYYFVALYLWDMRGRVKI